MMLVHIKQPTLAEAVTGTPPPVVWKISAAWASTMIDCTAHGITREGGCRAKCCYGPTYWPGRAGPYGLRCAHLGNQGCTLKAADKPVTCHLYPLRLNAKGTLVLHNAAILPHGCCRPNYQRGGRMIIEVLAPSLRALFGKRIAGMMVQSVKAGKDFRFKPPKTILQAVAREEEWAAKNQVPELRSKGA